MAIIRALSLSLSLSLTHTATLVDSTNSSKATALTRTATRCTSPTLASRSSWRPSRSSFISSIRSPRGEALPSHRSWYERSRSLSAVAIESLLVRASAHSLRRESVGGIASTMPVHLGAGTPIPQDVATIRRAIRTGVLHQLTLVARSRLLVSNRYLSYIQITMIDDQPRMRRMSIGSACIIVVAARCRAHRCRRRHPRHSLGPHSIPKSTVPQQPWLRCTL